MAKLSTTKRAIAIAFSRATGGMQRLLHVQLKAFCLPIFWLLLFSPPFFTRPASAADEIIIGVATALTSIEGRDSRDAVVLAMDQINAKGGVKVGKSTFRFTLEQIDLGDNASQIRIPEILAAFENFIRVKKVHTVIVGPFRSEVLLPAMDIASKHKVLMMGTIAMTAATDAKVIMDPKYRYFFRLGLNARYLVAYLINTMKFLKRDYGLKRVYIMNQDVAWARAATSLLIKLYFERDGWQIVDVDTVPSGISDFSAGLHSAAHKGAQVILPLFDMPQSGVLVEQWHRLEIPAVLCGFISPMVGPQAWETFNGEIAGALNLIFELGNLPAAAWPPAADFHQAFAHHHNREIQAGHGPAPSYEAVHILAEALERAASLDPDALVNALEKTDRLGAMGRMRFNAGHQLYFGQDPRQSSVACLIQWTENGRRQIVYPPALAEGEIRLPPLPESAEP
jgi:branched-chain amino acid transport system substrate-binding protein